MLLKLNPNFSAIWARETAGFSRIRAMMASCVERFFGEAEDALRVWNVSSKPFLKRYFGMGVRRLNDSQVDVTARAEFFAQRTAIYSAIYSAKISPFITTCRTAEKQKKDESILLDVMKMEI